MVPITTLGEKLVIPEKAVNNATLILTSRYPWFGVDRIEHFSNSPEVSLYASISFRAQMTFQLIHLILNAHVG